MGVKAHTCGKMGQRNGNSTSNKIKKKTLIFSTLVLLYNDTHFTAKQEKICSLNPDTHLWIRFGQVLDLDPGLLTFFQFGLLSVEKVPNLSNKSITLKVNR